MKKLGVAIIGTGNISSTHLRSFLAASDLCEVKALCDLYPHKAQALAAKGNLVVSITDDYHTLLDRDEIDLVSLCLPPSIHAQVASDFLDAGKHVLVEKPMAPSLEACDRMIEAQERSGKILSVISQNRFFTAPMRVKQLIDDGALGRILFARVNSMWWRGSNYYDLWWRGTYEHEGGGCTLNHAVHQIDILQWLIGFPTSVYSVMRNVNHTNSEVEDLSISILSYPSMVAEVNATLVDHDEKQEFFFAAEKASVGIPWYVKSVKQLPNGFYEPNPVEELRFDTLYEDLEELTLTGHEAQVRDVLSAIIEDKPPLVSGVEGRKAVELITAMYKSSTEGAVVNLPLGKDDPFYTLEGMLPKMNRFYKKSKSVENLEDGEITL